MNVLYTCNDNYIWLMCVSMKSILENNKERDIKFHVISDDITLENKQIVSNLVKTYCADVFYYDIPVFEIDESCFGRWPKIAFARLFCYKVLPDNIDKILYLDCDTIVKGNLSELFDMEYNKAFNGVLDCISAGYKKNIGLSKNSFYINAGVLILNLTRIKQMNMEVLISDFILKYKKKMSYADQDLLNGCFNNEIGILEPKYDVMTIEFCYSYKEILKLRSSKAYYDEENINEAVKNPIIIHYTTNLLTIRPWYSNSNHPRKKDFLDIFNNTPYSNHTLNAFTFSGKKNIFIKICLKLPKFISLRILGFVHSKILPFCKKG